VHVTQVYKDSVLARTGLTKGDVLCRVDGMDVDAFGELSAPSIGPTTPLPSPRAHQT
jgi:S1-C subfamily serine protease